jgi:hypothetical protein
MIEFAESFGFFAGPLSAGGLLDAFGGSEKGAGPYRPAMVSPIQAASESVRG